MATLKSQMLADVSGVFLNTDEHAETVTLYPAGAAGPASEISVIVTQDALYGTNETVGDGWTLNDSNGYSIRESIIIEASADAGFQDEQDPRTPDVIVLADGSVYAAKRILGRDNGAVSVLCVRMQKQLTRYEKWSG